MAAALRGFCALWALAALFTQTPAEAQIASADALPLSRFEPRLLGDVRLRYETADDDRFADASHAVTLRLRLGAEVRVAPHTHILAEFEGVGAPLDGYDDGVGPAQNRPLIPDAEIAELNRFQLSTSLAPRSQITLGRQRLSLNDERFIGGVAFRQNEQTFDGVWAHVTPFGAATLDVGYIRRVNRFFSRRSPIGRFRGDSFVLHAEAPSPIGRLGAFHYALDLEVGEGAGRNSAASSQTSGARLSGRWHADRFSLFWNGVYAVQRDWADNPADYTAQYWVAEGAADAGDFRLTLRSETLGAQSAGAFQTPLGTNHAFQGSADLFLVTPAEGVVDRSAALTWRLGSFGALRGVAASARYHRFQADRGDSRYGQEIDVAMRAKLYGAAVSIEYASYYADAFAADSRRLWVTAERPF
ncbi:MAG: hypothetical protein AAF527_01080 [Pseudomonadota bacterium]